MIGLARIISVLLNNVTRGRQQFIEYPRVGGRLVGAHRSRERTGIVNLSDFGPPMYTWRACCIARVRAAESLNRGWSDRHDQLVEGSRDS